MARYVTAKNIVHTSYRRARLGHQANMETYTQKTALVATTLGNTSCPPIGEIRIEEPETSLRGTTIVGLGSRALQSIVEPAQPWSSGRVALCAWVATFVFALLAMSAGAISVGDDVRSTTNGLNIRSGPSIGAGVEDQADLGDTGKVIDGPRIADGYIWWRVNWDGPRTGWSVHDFLQEFSASDPDISSVSPQQMPASGSRQWLTINGSDFQSGATLEFDPPSGGNIDSSAQYLTRDSSSRIRYNINNDNDSGTWRVRVINPDGERSGWESWAVGAPPSDPDISSVSPQQMPASGSRQWLTVNGSDFQSGATLEFDPPSGGNIDSSAQYLTRDSSTRIRYYINNDNDSGNWRVRVINPDGERSGWESWTVGAPPSDPDISSVSPQQMPASGSRQWLTINGSDFQPGAMLEFDPPNGGNINSSAQYLTRDSSTRIRYNINNDNDSGTWRVRVINPDGERSGWKSWTVGAPPSDPEISSTSPQQMPASGSRQWLTINGSDFQSGATLEFDPPDGGNIDSSAQYLTWDSSSRIRYYINNDNDSGTWRVRVINPDGQMSDWATWVVSSPATVDVEPVEVSLSSGSVEPGGQLTVSWHIRNNGTGTAGTSNSQVRLTTSASSYGGPGNNVGAAQPTGSIAPGQSEGQDVTVSAPSTPGTYYAWVIADNSNPGQLIQTDVANDFAVSAPFTVSSASTVDVEPIEVSLSSGSVEPGGQLTVSWRIRNNGTGTAGTSNSQVRFTSSASSYGGPGNNFGAAQPTGSIGPGQNEEQDVTVSAPSAPGTYYAWVIADNSNPGQLTQTDVSNDFAVSAPFTVSREPQDVTSDWIRPLTGNWNISFGFLAHAPNEITQDRYHLGEDVPRAAGTPVMAAGDGVVKDRALRGGGYGHVVVIEHTLENGQKVCTVYGHLRESGLAPLGFVEQGTIIGYLTDAPGQFGTAPHLHFGVRAGSYAALTAPGGTDSDGQWRYRGYGPISVSAFWMEPSSLFNARPDLVVEDISFTPNVVSPGETVGLTYTIRNRGNGTAGATFARMRLSVDDQLTSSDPGANPLDEPIPAIPAQEGHEVTLQIAVPESLALGQYFIGVFADAGFDLDQPTFNDSGLSAERLVIESGGQVGALRLDGIDPPEVQGFSGETTLTLAGSGFAEGAFVRLFDLTNAPHGPFDKQPTTLTPTEITIAARLTQNAATWTAQVVNPGEEPSNQVSFLVIGQRTQTTISEVTSDSDIIAGGISVLRVSGSGFPPDSLVRVRHQSGSGGTRDLIPSSATGSELWVPVAFDQPGYWSVQIISPGSDPSQVFGVEVLPSDQSPADGVNPSKQQVSNYLELLSAEFKIPAPILKALVWQESRWNQFRGDGTVVLHPEPDGRVGIGLTQITVSPGPSARLSLGRILHGVREGDNAFSISVSEENVDIERLKRNWQYNLRIGARFLLAKRVAAVDQVLDARILGNWYYSLAYYNGTGGEYNNDPSNPLYTRVAAAGSERFFDRLVFPYQECIYNSIAHHGLSEEMKSHFGDPYVVTLPGPGSVATGSGSFPYLSEVFRFYDYAEYNADGTVEMKNSSGGRGVGHAVPRTYADIAVHVVGFGSQQTGFARLTGMVEDAAGNGIAGVQLAAAPVGDLASQSFAYTDENGDYSFEGLPSGVEVRVGVVQPNATYDVPRETIQLEEGENTLALSSPSELIPPEVVVGPTPSETAAGAEARFSVEAQGTGPLRYQWFIDGIAVEGEEGNSLAIVAVPEWEPGQEITVEVSNPAGTVVSPPATLRVHDRPELAIAAGADGILLSWPTGWSDVSLEESTDLAHWSAVSLRYNPATGQLEVPVGAATPRKYFRLRQQSNDGAPEVVFTDDFDDNALAPLWSTRRSSVFERNQQLEVHTEVTDSGGIAESVWFEMPERGVSITRRAFVEAPNNYSIPRFTIEFDNSDGIRRRLFGVYYARMVYQGGNSVAAHGTYLGLGQGNPASRTEVVDTEAGPPVLWGQWFDERLTYDRESGVVRYYRNGVEEIVGVAPIVPAGEQVLVHINAWGWWTGHKHFTDDLVITSR